MLTTFIRKKAGHYNISEMLITLGVFSVLAIFPALAVGALLYYVLAASNDVAVVVPMLLWTGCVAWLWISFVLIGRESPDERISTGDLTAMQIISTVLVSFHAPGQTALGGNCTPI